MRAKIDQLSSNIARQVSQMEKEIKEIMVQQLVNENTDEFTLLLEEIEQKKQVIRIRIGRKLIKLLLTANSINSKKNAAEIHHWF